jgi:hypothetical protein
LILHPREFVVIKKIRTAVFLLAAMGVMAIFIYSFGAIG